MKDNIVRVVGAGLAGCEASLTLANLGIDVELYDIKPNNFTPAHHNPNFAELVCSNSLKSDTLDFATGILKAELRIMGSNVLDCADVCKIPSGKTLSVDRDAFANEVTKRIKSNPKIHVISQEITTLDDQPTIIATGPLTTPALSDYLKTKFGENL
ncbi:MAG: FAD-dependent oxidoreductase, partial [Christensenellales bacterium]